MKESSVIITIYLLYVCHKLKYLIVSDRVYLQGETLLVQKWVEKGYCLPCIETVVQYFSVISIDTIWVLDVLNHGILMFYPFKCPIYSIIQQDKDVSEEEGERPAPLPAGLGH